MKHYRYFINAYANWFYINIGGQGNSCITLVLFNKAFGEVVSFVTIRLVDFYFFLVIDG